MDNEFYGGGVALVAVADAGFSITTSLPETHAWYYYNGDWCFLCYRLLSFGLGMINFPLEQLSQIIVPVQNPSPQPSATRTRRQSRPGLRLDDFLRWFTKKGLPKKNIIL